MILTLTSQILNSRLDTLLPSVWPQDHELIPATKQELLSVDRGRMRPTARESMGQEFAQIWRGLGHIEVNPQRSENTSSLRYAYVYGENAAIDKQHWIPANSNATTRSAFIRTLIQKASIYRDHFLSKQSRSQSDVGNGYDLPGHSILCGPRGSGKTFFLNHVLSRHSVSFDQSRTVWVRLNLTKNFGADTSLTERIYAQVTKILLRYYDPASNFFPTHRKRTSLAFRIGELTSEFIENEFGKTPDRDRMVDKWRTLTTAMQKGGSEPTFEPASYPTPLCQYVYNEALRHGLAFIIVLDGLDCLDYVTEAEDRYKELRAGCAVLAQAEELFGATFLFVLRDSSQQMQRVLTPNAGHNRSKPSQFQVCLPSIQSIVRRRIDLLKRRMKSSPPHQTLGESATWADHLERFFGFLSETAGQELNRLSIAGDNRRGAMQVVQAKYQLFLDDESSQEYRLTEILCTKGEDIPSMPYSYYQQSRSNWQRHAIRASGFDSHFLPRLFCSPYLQDNFGNPVHRKSIRQNFLAPLRIVQLVSNFGKPTSSQKATKSVRQIAESMHKFFDYDEEVVRVIIEELALHECLAFVDGERATGSDLDTCLVKITPKGLRLFPFYLADVTYLALYAMLIPISKASTELPFFSIGSPFVRRQDRVDWVGTKVLNSMSACRLIVEVNNHERERYLSRSRFFENANDPISLSYRDGKSAYFSYIGEGEFKNEIESQIHLIIHSIPLEGAWSRIPERIKNYARAWSTLQI